MRVGVPRRTLALTGANALSAAGQGQFMFVLPWMLLARGHSPTVAALATAFVYVPLLVTVVPAGLTGDGTDPLRLLRLALAATLAASALYPLATLLGTDAFWLVLLAALVAGTTRNYAEAALLRGIGDTTEGSGMLRAHAIRTTVNQAAIFGSPFLGLLLFRLGGSDAVLLGICGLQLAALAVLVPVPPIGPGPDGRERPPLAVGLASLRANPRLRRIGWVNLTWNVFSGAALGIMPAVLREHVGMDEVTAGATLVAGGVAVVLLTLPVVRTGQRRVGPLATFLLAVAIEGAALLLLADASVVGLVPLVYVMFLLSNSAAAASLNGARALEVTADHQSFLNLVLMGAGLVGFVVGLVLAAGLLGPLDFTAVLVLIGVGMALTAAGFRRPLVAT